MLQSNFHGMPTTLHNSPCLPFICPKHTYPHILFFPGTRAAITTLHSASHSLAQLRPYVTLKSNLSNYVFSAIPSCAFELVAPFEKKPGLYFAGYRLHTHTYSQAHICKLSDSVCRGCYAVPDYLSAA